MEAMEREQEPLNKKQDGGRRKWKLPAISDEQWAGSEAELIWINYLQCQKGFKTSKRVFDTPYFLYVHKGKGRFIIDQTEYFCSAGDLFYCPAGKANTIIADDGDPYLLSGMDFNWGDVDPGRNMENTGSNEQNPNEWLKEHIHLSSHPQFLWLTMELIRRKTVEDIHYRDYVRCLFRAWLALVFNLSGIGTDASIAEQIAAYIAEHQNRNITLNELAAVFKYHPTHLNRIFKKRFGVTLKQYHHDIRIRKAMELLRSSDAGIGEIAAICGFEDSNYFSRLFKKKTNQSPRRYREKLVQEETRRDSSLSDHE